MFWRRRIDGVLYAAALVGLGFSLLFFFRGSEPQSSTLPALSEIGQLSVASEEVRRRHSKTLVWDRLRAGGAVYPHDSLFVPPGVFAVIDLSGGASLQLEPDTLVVLPPPLRASKASPVVPRVELQRGGVTVVGDAPLTINAGDFEAKGQGKGRWTLRRAERVTLEVREGKVRAQSVGDAPEDVDAGTLWTIAPSGQKTTAPITTCSLQSPAYGRRFWLTSNETVRVQFAWNADCEGRVELARDAAFGRDSHLPEAQEGWAVLDEAGPYYWRVVNDQGEALSRVGVFAIMPCRELQMLHPAADETVVAPLGNPLVFRWAGGAISHYRWSMFEGDSSTPSLTQDTRRSEWAWAHTLDEGWYRWRVHALNADGEPVCAPSLPQRVRVLHRPAPPVPVLLRPHLGREKP